MKNEPESQYQLLSYRVNDGTMHSRAGEVMFSGSVHDPSIHIHLPTFPHSVIHLFPDGTWRIVNA